MLLTGLRPPGPLVLDANAASNWKRWYRAYGIYAIAMGVDEKPEDVQCCLFLHMAGDDAHSVHANLQMPARLNH